jgi:hypothetical protein
MLRAPSGPEQGRFDVRGLSGSVLILIYSDYDQQWGAQHGGASLPDRAAHGNWDYLSDGERS